MTCRFFHDWHFARELKVVQPKCGPYDPRDDEGRTVDKEEFICCDCGQTKLCDPPSYYFY